MDSGASSGVELQPATSSSSCLLPFLAYRILLSSNLILEVPCFFFFFLLYLYPLGFLELEASVSNSLILRDLVLLLSEILLWWS